jgi:hypothetical protein
MKVMGWRLRLPMAALAERLSAVANGVSYWFHAWREAGLFERISHFRGRITDIPWKLLLRPPRITIDIDHSRTKTKSPQTNDICERFHKTCSTNFTASRSAKRCIVPLTSCRPILMLGCGSTMKHAPIRDAGASAKRRCRPSLMQSR